MLVRIFDFVNKHKFFSLLCLLLWAGVALWGVWQLRFEGAPTERENVLNGQGAQTTELCR